MRSGKCFPLLEALCTALETHGVSQHLVWILQLLYDNQRGQVLTDSGESREFDIRRGVRQGCVLSPGLFSSVLEWALSKWRMRVRTEGIDLEDGGQPLLDLRFADDIWLSLHHRNRQHTWLMNLSLHWQTSVGFSTKTKRS